MGSTHFSLYLHMETGLLRSNKKKKLNEDRVLIKSVESLVKRTVVIVFISLFNAVNLWTLKICVLPVISGSGAWVTGSLTASGGELGLRSSGFVSERKVLACLLWSALGE